MPFPTIKRALRQFWRSPVLSGIAVVALALGIGLDDGDVQRRERRALPRASLRGAFSVNRRRREIGIRMAMGASPAAVLRMVLRQGVGQLAVGMFTVLLLSLALTRALEIMLFGVEPYDPLVFAAVASVLGAAGLAAVALPAGRASTVHPMASLREE